MSDSPPASHKYLTSNAVRSQIVTDVKEISATQVVPAVIMAVGGFLYAWASGQLTSVKGLKFVVLILLAGVLLYFLLAVIRAPIIVIGWHLRQISSLSLKVNELQSTKVLPSDLPVLGNSFSDFPRVKRRVVKPEI